MTHILMYNTANQHIQEVFESDSDRINRLAEAGWRRVEKYELIAVFSPSLNEHKTVIKADVQTWLNQGYYAEPTWVFHPEKEPRMVSKAEAEHLFGNGWYDTPAKFPPAGATQHSPNGSALAALSAKPLNKMTKAELIAYALDVHKLELSPDNMTVAEIIAAIEAKAKE